MPEKVSLKRALGIAGKDTVAVALIAKGVSMIDGPQRWLGVACIVLGAACYVIQPFLEASW